MMENSINQDLLDMIGVGQSIPRVNFTEHIGLLIAPPKWGKTTMGSLLPNSVFFPFEKGEGSAVIQNKLKKLNTWEDFVFFINVFEMNREKFGNSIGIGVIDTVNKMYSMCEEYILRIEGKKDGTNYKNLGDIPHGKGYPSKDKEFIKQLDRLTKLGIKPFFITHSKDKTIRPKNGEPYEVSSTTMDDRLSAIIFPLVDYIIIGDKKNIINEDTGDNKMTRVLVVSDDTGMAVASGGRNYINTNIPFDTESEAIEKFQEVFQEGIKKKLLDRGITKDFDEIVKEQKEKLLQDSLEYAKEHKIMPREESIAIIKEKVQSSPVSQDIVLKFMQDNKVDFGTISDGQLRDLLEALK